MLICDGDRARQGQPVLNLDPADSAVDSRTLAHKPTAARLDVAAFTAALAAPEGTGPDEEALRLRLLSSDWAD